MPGMTQADYARHRGVKPPHINRLVKAGKIPVGEDGRINPADADYALDKDRARVNTPAQRTPQAQSSGDGRGLTQARTATEVYKARLAQLQYEERVGNALPLEGVVDAAAMCGETSVRIVRSLSMQAEAIDAASRSGGIAGVRVALKGIERDMLTRMASAFAKMAADATAVRAPEPQAAADDDDAED